LLTRLVERLSADDRVQGAVLLAAPGGSDDPGPGDAASVLIASTWNGYDDLVVELPDLATLVGRAGVVHGDGPRLRCILEDLTRLDLEVVRISDLSPAPRGIGGHVLADRDGVLAQWVRWSAGRTPDPVDEDARRAERLLALDETMRLVERSRPQAQGRGVVADRPFRHATEHHLRRHRERLGDTPVERALVQRIDDLLLPIPQCGEGLVITGDDEAYERFLAVADAEGFRGDRPLFEHARERLTAMNRGPALFEQGFLVPTFDAVEARFRLDVPTGGCKVPLVPAVYVGVGVTPQDHLEVWAAPAIRAANLDTACVWDDGERTTLPRAGGKDPLLAALDTALDVAYERVPDLIARTRRSAHETVKDARAVLAPLHLPASHVEGVLLVAAGSAGIRTRQDAALALCRSAANASPLVARKLALAAGRLLALAAPDAADDDAPC
jgi:hypothetical protein